jgi:hypothetical protein
VECDLAHVMETHKSTYFYMDLSGGGVCDDDCGSCCFRALKKARELA